MDTPNPPPHRRLRLRLNVEADDLDSLRAALHAIGNDLDHEGIEQREQTSGGYDSGHHLTLTCDELQSGARFREQLEAWRTNRVEEARGG